MKVTYHALTRYMERKHNFDFVPLRIEYAIEHGLPSSRCITDKDFIQWVEKKVPLQDFKDDMHKWVNRNLDEKERNIIYNNKRANLRKRIDNNTVVIKSNCIVTFF